MSGCVALFGELLLRLDARGFSRLIQADHFKVHYTGGEANAGAALAAWGRSVRMVSRVPAHDLGEACVNHLRRYGLDARHVQRGGGRLGLMYVEAGVSQRQSQVIYDRKDSAFTAFDEGEIDWSQVFDGASWFHFTGTAPAVSSRLAPVLKGACEEARKKGLTVSCDLNYRRKLWSPEAAAKTMGEIVGLVDVFVCGVEDAAEIFGIRPAVTTSHEAAVDAARQLHARFGCSHVAIPLRENRSATNNLYAAMLYASNEAAFSRTHEIPYIVDRIGAGDAMTAGLIHGILSGWPSQRTIEFAAAAGCLKHTIPGDFNLVSAREVEALAAGDGSGRIQR